MGVKLIHCAKCSVYLGEIKLAKIRTNTKFLCENCERKYKICFDAKQLETSIPKSSVLDDLFKGFM